MKIYIKHRILSSSMIILIMIFLIISTSSCQSGKLKSTEKPNIILIFTDQQHANMMSAAGNPYLKTPAIDLLAKNGIMFTRAYCTSPVCGPARSSIISGRMPHETGVEWNGQTMRDNITNSGEIFKDNGYKTVWAGKWHLPESYPQMNSSNQKTIKGFELLPFWKPELKRWFLGSETDPPLTIAVADFLKNYNKEKPLFLAVSYHNPHDICYYPRKLGWVSENDSLLEIRDFGFKYKLPDVIGTYPGKIKNLPPLPANFKINENEPEFIHDKRKYNYKYGVETKFAYSEFGELEWQGYLNAYNHLTEMADKEIGKIIEALKENGYWENSLIIFTSDHGDGAASHKWAAKLSLYEESSRIPMIVISPEKISAGGRDDKHLVSQIDILPTMLEFAGIKTDLSFTGKSIKTIISNQTVSWRDYLVVELADSKKDTTRKGRMVRLDQYKYNIYSTGEEQLFYTENDSGEMINLAGKPEFEEIRIRCRQKLKLWGDKTNDNFALSILKK